MFALYPSVRNPLFPSFSETSCGDGGVVVVVDWRDADMMSCVSVGIMHNNEMNQRPSIAAELCT